MKKFFAMLMTVLFLGATGMVLADGTTSAAPAGASAPAPKAKGHKGHHKGAKKGKKTAAPAPATAPAK